MEPSRKGDCRMKKFLALICIITCIFGLTACGSEAELTEYEQQKITHAETVAAKNSVVFFRTIIENDLSQVFEEYTLEEVEYLVSSQFGILAEGKAVITGIESFHSAMESAGDITEIGEAKAEIDGKQIIVLVDVVCENKEAQAEIILSNDQFFRLESASLNPVSSVGEMMGKAALNTLIGMGTVFIVLILISAIISAFGVIPKIQDKFTKKKEETVKEEAVSNAVAQITKTEEMIEETEEDNLELIAVIAAAIAASEGAASADGFVVRSIRKVRRTRNF